jgi:hypothetical protein
VIPRAGIEIRSYLSDSPITLADESGEIMTVVHSLASSFERRRARARTYDALRRRAEAGAVTGGKLFGYKNVRNGAGYVHRSIDDTEAAIVRRVFEMYAEGTGIVTIAHTLTPRASVPLVLAAGRRPASVRCATGAPMRVKSNGESFRRSRGAARSTSGTARV